MSFQTPLQEAVVEVNFGAAPLVEFRAQSLHNLLRSDFPTFIKFPFFLVPQEGQAIPPYVPAYRFFSEDQARLVQYGPRVISYNRYRYPGWNDFRAEFTDFFYRVTEAGFGQGLERAALTYVNRMPASTPQELQGLLSIDLGITAETVPLDFIIRRVEARPEGLLNVTFMPIGPDQFSGRQSMGVTCVMVRPLNGQLNLDALAEIFGWFEAAHAQIRDKFWSLLSEEVQNEWRGTIVTGDA